VGTTSLNCLDSLNGWDGVPCVCISKFLGLT
jgi:hypothetical protein